MSNPTRFKEALDYIRTKYGDNQSTVATKIATLVCGIDKVSITRYKNGALKASPEVISAMNKIYHINPNYLKGTSDVLPDRAGLLLEQVNSIFSSWSTVSKKYTDNTGTEITDTYLHLTMPECNYRFLQKVDHARFLQEQGMNSFDDELNICKAECNDTPSHECEYVLIPRNSFIEIINFTKQARTSLDEILDLEKHLHFCEHESN